MNDERKKQVRAKFAALVADSTDLEVGVIASAEPLLGLVARTTRPAPATLEQSIEYAYRCIMERQEQIIEAFIAETGCLPSECELVHTFRGQQVVWTIQRRKTDV